MQHRGKENRQQRIVELAKELGVIRPRDVEAVGIPREYLLRLYRRRELIRIGRGLYTLPDQAMTEFASLVEVAKRVPDAVICLLSALRYHNLTTELPRKVWIAIKGTSWKPSLDYPALRVFRFSGEAFEYGTELHEINKVPVKVYSVAKTVADCFKFRNKVGLDIAIEALRDVRRKQAASMDELWEAAKVCRVARVIRPYLEAIA
jgi:predicted transcriptional regulator of viral defense system